MLIPDIRHGAAVYMTTSATDLRGYEMVSPEAWQRNERLFISVARPDRPWARWIGQELRRSGYDVELDEWSWRVGTSFVDRMERAIAAADRMIAVLSPAYFARESYGREEREAALRRAHDRDGFLIPVLVEPCDPSLIVGRLSHIDLTGRDETTARQLLIQGVRGPQPPHLDEDMPWPGRPPATPAETLESNPFPGTTATAAHGNPARSVVVFHPSELRLGRQDGLGEVIGTDAFMQALCDDIEQLGVQGEWVPDLLVLTGDLAEHGRRSEYGQASRLLEGLLARLQLEWHRVGIIPGEKDVNMAACRSYFEACAAEEVEPTAPYWPKWRFFEEMFAAVYRTPPAAAFAVGQEWSLFEMKDLRVVVAGLNSTMKISPTDTDHGGWLGGTQARWFTERLAEYERQGWLRIGVVHHNPVAGAVEPAFRIHDYDNIASIGAKLNLLLHGHGNNNLPARLNNSCLVLSTGSPSRGEAFRYQVLRLDANGVTLRSRAYLSDERRWVDPESAAGNAPGAALSTERRLEVDWKSAHATFPSKQTTDTEARSVKLGPGESTRARLRIGDPSVGHGGFIARVAEIARLRYARAPLAATVTQIEPTEDSPGYLRVTCRDGMIVSQHPVGVYEGDPSIAAVDRFAERVHRTYAATDAQLVSDLVVGGGPPSADLVAYARRQGVRLVSFIEYQGLMDLRDYVVAQTTRLELDPLYPPELYMPQRFHRLDDADQGPGSTALEGELDDEILVAGDDVFHQVVDWLGADQARLILLLGDFGRGKTFLLHELARRLPETLPHVVPMLVELRHLEKAHGVDQLVAAHLLEAGVGTFEQEKFRYMLRQGRIVLLFDGFDELALRITYERATEHLDTLVEALDGQAKIVLTSRTQHFRSDHQIRTALGRRVEVLTASRVAILDDFTETQVEQYLARLYRGDERRANARMRLIRDIHDLLGLSGNPRMLGFVARLDDVRLRQVQARTGRITSADLYQELLRSWLDHEARRARPAGAAPTLTAADMWGAVTALALRLWQTTEQTINLAELAQATGRVLTTLKAHGMDEGQAAHQVGAGTLLVRSGDDTFTFIHASVMEYLVASACAAWLRNRDTSDSTLLELRPISPLMIDFIVGLASRGPVLSWTRSVLADPDAIDAARANALTFARVLDPSAARGARLTHAHLSGLDLTGLDLTDADLSYADLTDVRATGAVLGGTRLRDATLRHARLHRVDFTGADLGGADFTEAQLTECDVSATLLDESRWTRAALLGCEVPLEVIGGASMASAAISQRDTAELMGPPGAEIWSMSFSPDGQLLAYAAGSSLVIADLTTGRLLRTSVGHTGTVLSVVHSADGATVVTAGGDGAVRLWNAQDGTCRQVLDGHRGAVRSVVFSPDGATLASGGDDGTVRLWQVRDGSCRHVLEGDHGPVKSLAFSPDGGTLATGSGLGAVHLWDPVRGSALSVLARDHGGISVVAFSPDGVTVAAAGEDGAVHLWDVQDGSSLHVLEGDRGAVTAVAFSPDGVALASGGDFGMVRVWDPASGSCVQVLEDHRGPITTVVFSPDGATLASGSYDGTVRLWDVTYGACRRVLDGHGGPVWSVEFSPDGEMVATGSDFGTVRLWDVAYGASLQVLEGHGRPVWSVVASPKGTTLASASGDGVVRLWDAQAGSCRFTLEGHGGAVWSVTFSSDGATLASASDDGTVRLWDAGTGSCRLVLEGHGGPVWTVVFSRDGMTLASGGDDSTVRLWDAGTGSCRLVLEGHGGPVRSVLLTADGATVASASDDRSVRLWDACDGSCRRVLAGHFGPVHQVVVSADGAILASASYDGTVRLWDAADGAAQYVLEDQSGPVRSVAFSPDGSTLVSGSDDGKVRLWDVATGSRRHVLEGHSDWIWAVVFSPDGTTLVSGGDDGTVRLWDAQDGSCLHTLNDHRGWVRSVIFTPDGKTLVTASDDGTLRLRSGSTGGLIATLVGLRGSGWAIHRPDGTYHVSGAVGDEFWWAMKLCRFMVGELDPYIPTIRAVKPEA